uniref:Protein MIX23 n=1 Tax=Caligus clemensi TaxID=344056 RepID=C1C2T0_CALCM|nr:Coiled-coil domain-containing protein 58 [Caligus clemensi]
MTDQTLICQDVSHFGNTLKEMRILDDKIIYALNNSLPTASFTKDRTELTATCRNLSNQVHQTFESRRKFISGCIEFTQRKIDGATESSTKRNLRLKLRLIENENSVEDVVQNRTNKVLQERCRDYYNSSL